MYSSFQNTLYVHSDDEASDDETMENEVVYDFTNNLSQETHNSDTVPTAQNLEIQDQTNAEITIEAEKTPLTFEEQDETEIALNAHDSFGYYGKEKGQEAIPPHESFSAHPEPGATHTSLTQTESEEVSKQPEERQKHAKNSRKRGVSHKADNNLTVKKPGNQSRKNVESEKVVPPNPTLTSSSEDTETQKETWGAEHYKPPWGWNPIPFPDDTSWATKSTSS